jgi:putative hemolysin
VTAAIHRTGNGAGFTAHRPSGLEIRLAGTAAEIDAAQALRYRVFYQEMAARPTPETTAFERDRDAFDAVCDHLIIVDHDEPGPAARVVGTYRLLRRAGAARIGRFYSEGEFDISPLLANPGEILELGRSCVDRAYRTRAAMNLLWRGIAEYVLRHDVKLMFGCASLPGTDLGALAGPLSYLYHHHLAPPALRARALPERYIRMDFDRASSADEQSAIAAFGEASALAAALPPLLKGYLRLGGFIGDGAVIDEQFNTTDVCLIVPSDGVTQKYLRHFLRVQPA